MGYESKLYVVDKMEYAIPEFKPWGQVICMIDICKYPVVSDFMREHPDTDCYIYADDGNTEIIEDRYGEPLKECDVEELFEFVNTLVENGETYRRVFPLHAMLKSFVEHKNEWQNLKVLHFGH